MSLVGIAILPGNIHIVQLRKRKNGYALIRACHDPLPIEVFNNGKIVAFDLLTKCLREIVKRERIAGLQAAVCMSAEFALLQRMRMPAGITHAEVSAEIAAEVQKHAQLRREKMTMDFQILSQVAGDQIEVIFAVTPEEYVAKYQASVAMAGMQLAVLDLDAFAMQRVLSHTIDQSAMLYINEYSAVLAIIDADETLVYRRWDCQQMSCESWLVQCAELCQQMAITSIAIGLAESQLDYEKVVDLLKLPDSSRVDTFAEVQVKEAATLNNHSAFWLAYGLALRNTLPWLN